jgi:hypothetical protein
MKTTSGKPNISVNRATRKPRNAPLDFHLDSFEENRYGSKAKKQAKTPMFITITPGRPYRQWANTPHDLSELTVSVAPLSLEVSWAAE